MLSKCLLLVVGEVVEEIKIIQPVTVKTIVTENLKDNLLRELDALLKQTETELQYLNFKIKRTALELEKKHSEELSIIKNEFENEKNRNYEKIRKIKENMEAIKNLSLGEEIVKGSVDRIVNIKIGDNWSKLENCEIILKDNEVVEIRKGRMLV